MSRWWLVVLLGWLALTHAMVQEERADDAERAAQEARPPVYEYGYECNYSFVAVPESEVSGEDAHMHPQVLPDHPAPAPAVEGLLVAVAPRHPSGPSPAKVTFATELGPEVAALKFKFSQAGRASTLSVARDRWVTLGVACGYGFPFLANSMVDVEFRTVDVLGKLSAPFQRTIGVLELPPAPRHYRCHHATSPLLLLSLLLGLMSCAVLAIAALKLILRRMRIEQATAVPSTPYVASRIAAGTLQQQGRLAAMFFIVAVGTMITYPQAAALAVVAALSGLVAMQRWHRARLVLQLAASPLAHVELRDLRLIVADGVRATTLDTRPAALKKALCAEVPAVQARR